MVRGYHYKEDIATLRPYIREYRPVLIGVDGGADALMEAGYRPTSSSATWTRSPSARSAAAPSWSCTPTATAGRPVSSGSSSSASGRSLFPATGTSEDVAMLLADDKGASLIVAVGTHDTLVEFLDKGRSGMASTFLTRLRVGGKLVDAKGVSRLYRSRISVGSLLLLVATALFTVGVVLWFSPMGKVWLNGLRDAWNGFIFWLVGLFS